MDACISQAGHSDPPCEEEVCLRASTNLPIGLLQAYPNGLTKGQWRRTGMSALLS